MEIKVLGSAGGQAPGQNLTGFRIGADLLLDAGTSGMQLSLPEQRAIRHVLLTHTHLDHLNALPFLLDNLIGRVAEGLAIYSTPPVLEALRRDIFNGTIWPDFTRLPNPEAPVARLQPIETGRPFTAGSCTVEAVAVDHTVPAVAYLVACAFVGLNLTADFVQRYSRGAGRVGLAPPEARGTRVGGASPTLQRSAGLRWYGARVVHIGLLLAFVGIAGSGGFDTQKQVALRPGDRVQVGRFELAYNDLNTTHGANFTAVKADVSVYRDQTQIGKLSPSLALYGQSGKRTSEVDIRRTLASDLYVALTEVDGASRLINLTIFIKPLINWIWIGSALMVLGTALVLAAGLARGRSSSQGGTGEE